MEKIVIVGAGENAECVIAHIQEEGKFEIFGLLDKERKGDLMGYPILGDDELLGSLKQKGVQYTFPGAIIGAKANTNVGKQILEKIVAAGLTAPNLVSSRAVVRCGVEMGVGVLIQPSAFVDVSAKLGNGVAINPQVLVGHHCRVGNYVVFAGGAVLNARLKIGEEAFIGMGAKVFADVGARSKVAPGTVIMEPVPDDHVAFGNPTRIMPRLKQK